MTWCVLRRFSGPARAMHEMRALNKSRAARQDANHICAKRFKWCVPSFIHRTRSKAPLPQNSVPALALVDSTRIALMGMTDGSIQPGFVTGLQNEVGMIGHETPSPAAHTIPSKGLGRQIAIERIVRLAKKRLLATIAPLGHVVGMTTQDDADWRGSKDSAAGPPYMQPLHALRMI